MIKPADLKKPAKVRDLTVEELSGESREITEHLMKLRFQLASGQIGNPSIIRVYRRGLARIRTVLAEKQRSQQGS